MMVEALKVCIKNKPEADQPSSPTLSAEVITANHQQLRKD